MLFSWHLCQTLRWSSVNVTLCALCLTAWPPELQEGVDVQTGRERRGKAHWSWMSLHPSFLMRELACKAIAADDARYYSNSSVAWGTTGVSSLWMICLSEWASHFTHHTLLVRCLIWGLPVSLSLLFQTRLTVKIKKCFIWCYCVRYCHCNVLILVILEPKSCWSQFRLIDWRLLCFFSGRSTGLFWLMLDWSTTETRVQRRYSSWLDTFFFMSVKNPILYLL